MKTIEECVRQSNPVGPDAVVRMPDGATVPFSRVVALTNGEALKWLDPVAGR